MSEEQTTTPAAETTGTASTTPPAAPPAVQVVPIGDGLVAVAEGPITAAAIAEQVVEWGEPLPWDDLVPASTTFIHATALDVAKAAEWPFLRRFGTGPLDPAECGLFGAAVSEAMSGELIAYILERHPSAETLCIKLAELHGDPTPTREDLAAIAPSSLAQLELAVRLVPAVERALLEVNNEILRRRPPDPPPPATPIPLEETSLEQMPDFGERME